MALSTVQAVRRLTGLDDADAYLLFRLPDEAALDALITDELAIAAAYLSNRAGTNYTQTSDTNLVALMGRAEAYFVAMEIFEPLKSRKIVGTHAPFDSEDSLSYERLIDTEWATKFEMLVGPFINEDTAAQPYTLGVFATSTPVDRFSTDVLTADERNQDLIDLANGMALPR